jgi:hypothetical protein
MKRSFLNDRAPGHPFIAPAIAALLVTAAAFLVPAARLGATSARAAQTGSGELLPDLQTVIPQQIQIVNSHQREILRFSNGIANTGDGPLQMLPVFPLEDPTQTQNAIQQIFDTSGNIVREELVSQFEFHPEHNHWHIDAVALFELRSGSPTGPVVGGNSIKTTFCLIDWVKLKGNSPNPERAYSDCFGTQGISVGWVDQYHQSLDGQQLDITGAPPGLYYLVSTANPELTFIERDYTNNRAWVAFTLRRDSRGNPKLTIRANSFTTNGEGVPPDYTTNR